MLVMELRVGDTINIGDDVKVTLEQKSGNRARLVFSAPESVKINRDVKRTSESAATFGITGKMKE